MRRQRPRPLRALAVATVVPLAVLSLAGCGESAAQKYAKTPPATIDKDARAAITALKSVHISGSTSSNGSTLGMDMSLDTQGNCVGTITSGTDKIQIVSVSSSGVYLKADAAFWQRAGGVSAAVASQLAPKWVTGQAVAPFGAVCNLSSFDKSLSATTVAQDKPSLINHGTVAGTDVVNIKIANQDGSTSVLSVAANTPHNIIKVADGNGGKALIFSQFNTPVKATAPAGALNLGSFTSK